MPIWHGMRANCTIIWVFEKRRRKPMLRRAASAAFVAALICSAGAEAQIAKDTIKIGVLADMSSLYADLGGPGSTEAAKMAVADFGGTVAGKKNKTIMISGAASSDLTGKACAPTSVHWTYNTVALANGTGTAVVKAGGDTWFFITADYAFGHALERDTSAVVTANGGKVLGAVKAPLNTADFSSFLLQAQASKSKIIGLANAGGDMINSIKQAAEFGIVEGGQ